MSNIISMFNKQAQAADTIIVPSSPATQKTVELFTVDSLPLHSERGQIENRRGLFVGRDCINFVSDRYEIHQPSEIYQEFVSVAQQTGLEVNRVLTNPKNGGLLLSAKYADCKIISENHNVNLTFYTSHCGKYKTFLTLDFLRVACFNQVPRLWKNNERHIFSEKHYNGSLDIKLIGSTLEAIPGIVASYNEEAGLLIEQRQNVDTFIDMCRKHYKMDVDGKQYQSKVDKLKSIYFTAPGQRELPDSKYKAFQAVTFYNTHEGKNTMMKAERVYIEGSENSLKFAELLRAA